MSFPSLRSTLRTTIVFALFITTFGFSSQASGQSKAGRIAFGVDAGGNKYYGNFTDNQFAFSGDAFIRWNILDWLSVHAAYNGGQIHYSVAPNGRNVPANPQYFGTPTETVYPGTNISRDPMNVVRFGGWQAMVSGNVFPSESFVPYIIAGLEALNFEPRTQTTDASLPNNAAGNYSKNVIGGLLGTGFEMYISPKVTFNGKGLLHLTGTDWLDDYSNPQSYRQDAFLTMGVGFSYYIFTPDPVETVEPPTAFLERTVRTETTVYHTDTIFYRGPSDTVYISNPKVHTVYNFPGTLFMVNSDQFNTTEPDNMANLMQIKRLVDQCAGLRIEIQGYASEEGTVEHNQALSERRALRIKMWLMEQGISSNKISGTIGFGETFNAVLERSDVSAASLESARSQNRRIAVRVTESCN